MISRVCQRKITQLPQNKCLFLLQTLYRSNACFLLPATYLGTVPLLERETHVRVVRHPLQIHVVAEPDLAGKLRGPYLGHETVRQVSIAEDTPLSFILCES